MANFFAELKRRHIYRVAAAYAVVAWVLLQLIADVAPILELPPWVARAFLLLLVIGFPVAIVLAWTREPDGDLTERAMIGRLDWALLGALVVVIALVSYQQFASPSGTATATQKPGVETAREEAASPAGAISIVVLPFANLSGDASQEFFSDGMTEEITSALARVPDLRVVARTSAYQFRDQNRDIQSIGQQLRATHFIEGSVRKAGDRVRITAQLIKADNGTHLWAENYERQLTDLFAIQEEIARAIATSLRMPLGVRPGEDLVSNRKIDPESYQQFLRAKALNEAPGRFNEATPLLEQVVARNPDYAPAWSLLSFNYASLAFIAFAQQDGPLDEARRIVDEFFPKRDAAVQHAIRLDPNLPDGYVKRGVFEDASGKLVRGRRFDTEGACARPPQPGRFEFL
jgi:adenylate cyclase